MKQALQYECDAQREEAACKHQLIQEGKLVLTDSGYRLTAKGQKAVKKELSRYEMRPAMALMIEAYILDLHGHEKW